MAAVFGRNDTFPTQRTFPVRMDETIKLMRVSEKGGNSSFGLTFFEYLLILNLKITKALLVLTNNLVRTIF